MVETKLNQVRGAPWIDAITSTTHSNHHPNENVNDKVVYHDGCNLQVMVMMKDEC